MLRPGSSKALGAVHGKGGSHEANSNAVEFVIGILGTSDYDGLAKKSVAPSWERIGPRPGIMMVSAGKRASECLVRKERPRRLTSTVVVASSYACRTSPGPLHPDGDGRFHPALSSPVFRVRFHSRHLTLSGSDGRFRPARMGGERGKERVHALQHFAGFARALHLPP